ncbi:hypothetical protein RND81_08G040500 [Saponaria officinalis]|uniref:Transferase, Chloramphenicol acetyltransferase-like domain protein n=2 Tax=Saponaria officinalis TaxID=3572 RepID=A0AAW1J3J4_SAPOF
MLNPKIFSEEIIKPSKPTPTHLRYLKASLFDQVNAPVLMPIIFFYSKQHTPSTSTFLDRLKNSLRATLSLFYPLAGRVQNASYIDCNDMGVPYIEAKVPSIYLSEVVHKADMSLLDELLPSHGNDHVGYDKLLLAIQVITFACGGVTIGIKMNHSICDAFSKAMFVKTWASMARGGGQSLLPSPFFEIWKHFPPYPLKSSTNINIASKEPDSNIITIRPVTKWFMFTKEMCNELRSRLCSEYNYQNRPSLTMVLSSFIWSRVKLASNDKTIPHEVYHAINLRPKVDTLSKSYYYFGNMAVNAIAKPSLDNDKSLCHSFITTIEDSIEKISRKNGLIEGLQNGTQNLRYMMQHYKRVTKGEIVSLGFSSLRSLPLYEADFGWGKPVWVTSATLMYSTTVIMIPGGASSDDTYVYINLKPDQMAKLQADQEFMSFVSKCPTFGTFVSSKI